MKESLTLKRLYSYRHIVLIWLTGLILFVYLSIPFLDKSSGMYIPDLFNPEKKESSLRSKIFHNSSLSAGNEGLVFVTINKKQFLTRFVTNISDEELTSQPSANHNEDNEQKSFIIVGRKKSPKTNSSTKDFIIKASPKI